ncbi:hypothetical protein N8H22_10145 [Stutzerimonas stutzeri]|uniref:hypothetical protein n=1 Tax=Stutzerimonas sp. S1 TaxID=3030652 RepID=UPI0022252BD0|nr:hypothetical protein [Stutzerimonas sp. S1]MCW3148952.1 hypothetical protein [Stutzerimonas sp. S1]
MNIRNLSCLLLVSAATPFALAQDSGMTLEQQRQRSGAEMQEHREQLGRDINTIREPAADAPAAQYPAEDVRSNPRAPQLEDSDRRQPGRSDRPGSSPRPATTPTPIPHTNGTTDGPAGGMETGAGNGGAASSGPTGGAAAQPE